MKKIVILSDTHGNRRAIDGLDVILKECDYIFHLGDTSSDGAYIRANYPEKTFIVNGNCDPLKLGEDEIVKEVDGVKIFATHGHLYGVKSSLTRLAARANELDCDIALYGHTHSPREDILYGVTLINPGTLKKYSENTYCYLAIANGKAVAKTVKIAR